MSEHNDAEPDCPGEGYLSPWEKKCVEEWEKESILEDRLQAENERSSQKMWQSFQNSATAVSRLFKEGSQSCISLWGPFQNAAGSVTILYRDGHDLIRRSYELGTQAGIHRRTRDLLAWTKKRRRRIAREDLIAYLCGSKTAPPPRHRTNGPQFTKTPIKSASSTSTGARFSTPVDSAAEPDLQLFQDALALHGLNGAMSNVSVGRRQSAAVTVPSGASVAPDDYHGFLLEQIASHSSQRKRSSSAAIKDPNSPSSSPGHKRFRYDNDGDL